MGINSFRRIALPLALAPWLLAACSSSDQAPATPAPKPAEKTVFDPLVQTEQRARDVQTTVDENAERARKAVDAQERGDSSP